jgi:hypothetical protein
MPSTNELRWRKANTTTSLPGCLPMAIPRKSYETRESGNVSAGFSTQRQNGSSAIDVSREAIQNADAPTFMTTAGSLIAYFFTTRPLRAPSRDAFSIAVREALLAFDLQSEPRTLRCLRATGSRRGKAAVSVDAVRRR